MENRHIIELPGGPQPIGAKKENGLKPANCYRKPTPTFVSERAHPPTAVRNHLVNNTQALNRSPVGKQCC